MTNNLGPTAPTAPSAPTVALFHSVLGVRPGVLDAAERFERKGYPVRVIDQYGGRVFDDYAEAGDYAESVGYPALMASAVQAVADVSGPLVVAGFSNGGGMAECVALARAADAPVAAALLFSGAMPVSILGAASWPGTPVQVHYATDDPLRSGWLEDFLTDVRASGAPLVTFLDYQGAGHLFTDASLPQEFHPDNAELLFGRVFAFLDQIRAGSV